jgi:prevent-host-death family protein
MEKRFSATDARRRWGAVMSLAGGGDSVIIEKSGTPIAVVVPIQWYLTRMAEREARFAAFEASVASRPVYPDEVVEADIAEAIAAVRAERRAKRDQ